jgi:hypothetical protein
MPQCDEAVFIAIELPVFEVIDFRQTQRAVPQRYFVNRAGKLVWGGVESANQERRRRSGGAGRAGPSVGPDLDSIQEEFSADIVHHHRGMMPEAVRHRSRRGYIDCRAKERGGIIAAQPAVLDDEKKTIEAAVDIFADDSLNAAVVVGGAKTRR